MTMWMLASILLTGFALGLVHTLDPDHLMAIASLSASDKTKSATLGHAVLWAFGHGGILVCLAALIAFAGWKLPDAIPQGAERAVGLILVVAGASAIWLRHPPHGNRKSLRQRAPILVGVIHGLAGSAAMIALLPASLESPAVGLVYAVLFSAGVLVGMLVFGLLLGTVQQQVGERLPSLHNATRMCLGSGALVMGAWWLYSV